MNFPVTRLVARVRRHGGQLRIANGELQVRFGKPNKAAAALKRLLAKNAYGVMAILREEAAGRAYEVSGKDRNWWRTYDNNSIDINVVPAHIERAEMPDESSILKLSPDFAELKRLIPEGVER